MPVACAQAPLVRSSPRPHSLASGLPFLIVDHADLARSDRWDDLNRSPPSFGNPLVHLENGKPQNFSRKQASPIPTPPKPLQCLLDAAEDLELTLQLLLRGVIASKPAENRRATIPATKERKG